jgi:hypothetical protein
VTMMVSWILGQTVEEMDSLKVRPRLLARAPDARIRTRVARRVTGLLGFPGSSTSAHIFPLPCTLSYRDPECPAC